MLESTTASLIPAEQIADKPRRKRRPQPPLTITERYEYDPAACVRGIGLILASDKETNKAV